jgi:alcohol dehydrogenase class IV
MRKTWSFATAGQLVFGESATSQLGELLARRRIGRVLVVTDKQLAQAGMVDRVLGPLKEHSIAAEVFDGGKPEPPLDAVEAALSQARQFQPDALVALGGGSNMDLAKATAVVLKHGGKPSDYFGCDKVPGPVLPLVCLPTTAGTGSEVSHAAVLTDTANHIKVSMLSIHLRPALAVVDPELTYTCPRQVTADSGMDALTHSIESLTAVDSTALEVPPGETSAYEGRYPLGYCLAEKAIELIGRYLRRAVENPGDVEARHNMAQAATIAGMSFSNCGVGLVHALEYPLGGTVHCTHGAGNALLLPHVMRYYLDVRQSDLARVARLLGCNTDGMTERQAAESAIDAVVELNRAVGIPQRIRDLGGTEAQLPAFAEKSFAIRRLMWISPRKPTQDDLLAILRAAY